MKALRVIVVGFVLSACATSSVEAAPLVDVGVGVGVESFEWQEFLEDGTKLLTEDGFRLLLSGRLDLDIGNGRYVRGRGEVFFGDVDYDGATQDGTPALADTEYGGVTMEGDMLFGLTPSGPAFLGVYAGLGMTRWRRSIQDSYDPVAYGYDEDWAVFYLLSGLCGEISVGPVARLTGDVGLRVPLVTSVEYGVAMGVGDTTISVEPGKEPSFEMEVAVVVNCLEFAMFYRAWKFSKSNVLTLDSLGLQVWQPESESTMVGIRGTLLF